MPRIRWTAAMDACVMSLYSTESPVTLAHKLGISRGALKSRAFKIGAGPCSPDGRLKGVRGAVSSVGDKGGYVRLTLYGGRQVLQHRLVMEQHIGRRLRASEVVHHINGVKTDNRLCNLMLFGTKAEHYAWHLDNPEIGAHHPSRYNRVVIGGLLFCSRCSQNKDVSEFTKDSARRSGYSAYCRECTSAYTKATYLRRKHTNNKRA